MKTYTYKGKTRSALGNTILVPGEQVKLEESRFVKALTGIGLLEPVKEVSKPTGKKTKTIKKKN